MNETKLFDIMDDEDLARWAAMFRREYYQREDIIIREGQRATAFYIVDQGEIYAYIEDEKHKEPVAYFFPGDYFGETALLTGQPRNATVEVIVDAQLLVLDQPDFDQMVEEFPVLRDRLLDLGRQREEAGRARFSWQRPDEVTLFFSTKHWIAFVDKLHLAFLLGVLGIIVAVVYAGASLTDLLAAIFMLVAGTSLAVAVFLTIYHFLDWRNDHYIITSLRVLHVERVLLLREDRDEAPVERVQDVQVRQQGILANLLDFGDVIIQTAAATEKIVFADVPSPEQIRDALFSPMYHAKVKERAVMREEIRRELLHRLKMVTADESIEGEQAAVSTEAQSQEPIEKNTSWTSMWVQSIRQWIRDLVSFETWLVSDGGTTITWRKTGWLLFKVSITPIFSGFVIIMLLFLFLSQGIGLPVLPIFLMLVLLIIFGWWFYLYWDWQNDIYQISGSRLIDLKRRPLFLEELRRETTLDRIQNVSLSIPGPVAQLLHYGTVIIETAGETGAFMFQYVHDPRGVQTEIFRRWEQFSRQEREAEMLKRHAEMAEWFEIYDELKQGEGEG
jgi:membrane protein YdbS with pleckstrin-like domain